MVSSFVASPLTRTFGTLLVAAGIFYLGRISALTTRQTAESGPVFPPAQAAESTNNRAAAAAGSETGTPAAKLLTWKTRLEQEVPSEEREEDRLRMITAWARTDPLAALDYARHTLTQDRKAQAVSAVFTVWAQKDPHAAWNWVLTKESAQADHLRAVLSETGKNQPALAQRFAASYAQQHPEQAAEIYLSALDGVIHAGKYEDAKLLLAQATLPNEEQSNSLINFFAGQWGRYQPEKAASWVLALPAGPVRDQALDAVGQAWSDVNPLEAADFAVKLPPGVPRQTALKQAISKWTMDDPAQASKWILQFDAHQDFDQAVASLATSPHLMYQNTSLALGWAGTIQDEALRNQSTTTIVSNWYANDPTAALNYINTSSDLSPEARRELLRQVAPPAPAAPQSLRR